MGGAATHVVQERRLFLSQQQQPLPARAGTRRTAEPVDVRLTVCRRAELNHQRRVRVVDAPSGDVAREEDRIGACAAEGVAGTRACRLRHAAVDLEHARQARGAEELREEGRGARRLAEDHDLGVLDGRALADHLHACAPCVGWCRSAAAGTGQGAPARLLHAACASAFASAATEAQSRTHWVSMSTTAE